MKVRIAVAAYPTAGTDSSPVWIAYGRCPWGPPSAGQPSPHIEALRELEQRFGRADQSSGAPVVVWIEAEIPLPKEVTVEVVKKLAALMPASHLGKKAKLAFDACQHTSVCDSSQSVECNDCWALYTNGAWVAYAVWTAKGNRA